MRCATPCGGALLAMMVAILATSPRAQAQLDDTPAPTVRVTLALRWQRERSARVLVTMSRAALGFGESTLQVGKGLGR
jgi:hypothetical protein